ncbi:MAG TPA: pyridoxal-phosphate dependent enzyme [Ilumatobacteraceae bacterium]
MGPTKKVDLAAVERAREVVTGVVARTPIVASVALTERVGSPVVLKAENLQRTGAFKIRGAVNKLANLGPGASKGVTAGSAGNHAQALAFAAQHAGVPCAIFVPAGASIAKVEACRSYGATVEEGGASLAEAMAAANAHAEATGMVLCHPFDDPDVVAGQGTLGLELVDDVEDLGCVIVPVGGGGLASGVAIAVKSQMPHTRVVGVQAEVCAPYAGGSPPTGPVTTLADGIAVKSPGTFTRPLVEQWLDDIVAVDEDSIADAMVLLMERAKLYVEGAGAVGVAALLSEKIDLPPTGTTCVVLSGGNVDLGVVPGLIRRRENAAGRRLAVFVKIDDRPGGLAALLSVFAAGGANLIEVQHVREGLDLHVRETGVHATFEVRSRDHAAAVVAAVRAAGYTSLQAESGS